MKIVKNLYGPLIGGIIGAILGIFVLPNLVSNTVLFISAVIVIIPLFILLGDFIESYFFK